MSATRSKVPPAQRVAVPAAAMRIDLRGVLTWLISAGAVVYLGVNGGGYDTAIWAGLGVIVWWVVVLGALVALDLVGRPSRVGWLAIAALAGLVLWSAIGLAASSSDERTLNEVGRASTYFGVLVLAIAATRRSYARHLAGGIATGIVVISVLALLSRLHPSWFPASANETSALLPGARNRLSYPLDYWNALGALVALGIPLLLAFATDAHAKWRRSLAAAALPPLVLTLLLTLSRGGLLAVAVGLLVYLIVLRRRSLQALLAGAIAAAGSAVVSVVVLGQHDLRQGLDTPLAHHQGTIVLIVLVVVCVGVAAAQLGLSLVEGRSLPFSFHRPRLPLGPRPALAAVLIIAIGAFLAFGGPHAVSRAWASFKTPQLTHDTGTNRLGSLSGNGRYQYWRSSVHAMEHRPLTGIGGGTWEFWWTRNGAGASYALYAHSLVFETLAENGIPGGMLIIVFLAAVLVGTVRRGWQIRGGERAPFAAIAAACGAATVSLATDWSWQIAVLPISMLALAGVALGADGRRLRAAPPWRSVGMLGTRLAIIAAAGACLGSIVIPLGANSEIHQSQAAFSQGRLATALGDARSAARLEPYAATPWLQQALVLESAGHLAAAEAAARRAEHNESANWREPLILARIQAERREVRASRASARRAFRLNPSIRQYLP
jgi:hypothetical protein